MARLRRDPQRARMRLDDALADGQSETGSLDLQAEERLEHRVTSLLVHAGAGVVYRDLDSVVWGSRTSALAYLLGSA